MKKSLALILLALSLMLGVAAVSSAAPAVKNKDTFVIAVTGAPNTLDPACAYDSASGEPMFQIYENLIAYPGEGTDKFEPMLATKVPTLGNKLISADGKTYTFPIRKNVKFHDGSPLTPEDVKYSFMRMILGNFSGGPQWMVIEPLFGVQSTLEIIGVKGSDASKLTSEQAKALYDKVDKAIEISGNNVVFHLANAYAPFMNILSHGGSWGAIISKTYVAKNGGWDGKADSWVKYYDLPKEKWTLFEAANGTGAYKLGKWDRNGLQIILERNDNYWRKKAKIKTCIIKQVSDINARKLMLQQGDADAIYVPVASMAQAQDIPDTKLVTHVPQNTMQFFMFIQNIDTKSNDLVGSGKLDGKGIPGDFFSDINVRKAFTFAFDHKTYIEQVLRGNSATPTDWMPNNLPFANKKPMYSFDLKKAEEYFKKAFDGQLWDKGFEFTVVYNTGNINRQIASEMVKANLAKINPKFKVNVLGMEFSNLLDARKEGRVPMYAMGWHNDFPDAHNFAMPILHSQGDYVPFNGKNAIELAKKEFDPLIDKGIKEPDAKKRAVIYNEISKKFVDYATCLMTMDGEVIHIYRNWLKGVRFNVMWPGEGYYFYELSK